MVQTVKGLYLSAGRKSVSYVRRTLSPNEEILFMTGYHWLVWLEAAVLTAPTVAILVAGYPYGPWDYFYLTISLVAFPFGAFYFGRAVSTEIAVTSDRFVRKTGIISYDTEELGHDKIETVAVTQSVAGRLLGFGTVRVQGTGAGSIEVKMVERPVRLRHQIQIASERKQARGKQTAK
jgi:uncharacterized membrane protein YdbT with pleckstrin-like domain